MNALCDDVQEVHIPITTHTHQLKHSQHRLTSNTSSLPSPKLQRCWGNLINEACMKNFVRCNLIVSSANPLLNFLSEPRCLVVKW